MHIWIKKIRQHFSFSISSSHDIDPLLPSPPLPLRHQPVNASSMPPSPPTTLCLMWSLIIPLSLSRQLLAVNSLFLCYTVLIITPFISSRINVILFLCNISIASVNWWWVFFFFFFSYNLILTLFLFGYVNRRLMKCLCDYLIWCMCNFHFAFNTWYCNFDCGFVFVQPCARCITIISFI